MRTSAAVRRARRRFSLSAPARHFIRHHVEIPVVMMPGMVVLGPIAGRAMAAVGVSAADLREAAR
jgi:hypothetical protein